MQAAYKIVLIGAGNVATHLGKGFKKAGNEIVQVYSPTQAHSQALASTLDASFTTSTSEILPADIYIIAVKDDAVNALAEQLKLGGIVAHTSGSLDMGVLQPTSANYGVLYPLQTFSKSKDLDLKKVPFCIEASNKETGETLAALAKQVSNSVHFINSEQRRTLHLSAVFACNFVNHMYAIAADILRKKDLPFDVLLPLIEETAAKVKSSAPRDVQTGPAKRNDAGIMAKHIDMLKDDDTARAIYKLISYSIAEKK